MSADKLVALARRVHLEYRANVGSCWTGLERLVRAALDEAVSERDKEWGDAAIGVEGVEPIPINAKSWILHLKQQAVVEAVRNERRACIEDVRLEAAHWSELGAAILFAVQRRLTARGTNVCGVRNAVQTLNRKEKPVKEQYAIVAKSLDKVWEVINDVVEYGYSMEGLQQAQKEIKQFDSPDDLKIVKITFEDVPFDWRAEVESDKIDEAMEKKDAL